MGAVRTALEIVALAGAIGFAVGFIGEALRDARAWLRRRA